MSTYRIFTIALKRQVAQEYLAGASLNALSRKHEVARNLIRIWVAKYQAGEYEPDFIPMPRLSAHEIKIAELERMFGKLTMELEFLRGVLRSTPLQRGATTSIVTGPVVSPYIMFPPQSWGVKWYYAMWNNEAFYAATNRTWCWSCPM